MQPPPPPIQSNQRSYTRPIQPPTDFDPTQQRRPSHASTTTRTQDAADWDPRLSMRRSSSSRSQGGATTSSNEKPEDWAADEESMLQLYGLSSLSPEAWEESTDSTTGGGDSGLFSDPQQQTQVAVGASGSAKVAGVLKGDELDPLGLIRGGVLANHPEITSDLRSSVLLHSKSFDPKLFLSTIHPNATFADLNRGREKLKDNLESRSGALKLLVEAEWDRFVGVKGTTETVFEEMKHGGGPLEEGTDYGVKSIRETLKQASSRAETVFQPILDARTKADRLKSTLGVFERSKFFFNLPNILGEAVESGKYDVALAAYKKGRYILTSRPAQLLGLPTPTSASQGLQQKRIYEKVWGQVEKIVGDLRATLGKRLRDTKRGVEEVEKTIEILLELDPTDDPVWIFFDTHHRHILHLLKSSNDASCSRIRVAMDQFGWDPLSSLPTHHESTSTLEGGGGSKRTSTAHLGEENEEESSDEVMRDKLKLMDLRNGVKGLLDPNSIEGRENENGRGLGKEVWGGIFELVRNLNEVVMGTLPSFWKVAKGYQEGKYQKKNSSSSSNTAKRSPSQCRVMTSDIIQLYVSLVSQFFTLSPSTVSTSSPPPSKESDPNATPPMPDFVPPVSSALTTANYLLRILVELQDCISEMGALELSGDSMESLKELLNNVRWRFVQAVCSGWVRDAKIFYKLEDWRPDSTSTDGDTSTTSYLAKIAAFHRFNCITSYRLAGGSEESAQSLLSSSSTSSSTNSSGNPLSNSRTRNNELGLTSEWKKKVQGAFLDALYAFLDGLVHVAFSGSDDVNNGGGALMNGQYLGGRKSLLFASASGGGGGKEEGLIIGGEEETGRPKEVDVRNVDIRILLTVSNLTRLRESILPRLISQFQSAFKVDMSQDVAMLMEVTDQLDKILFDDYVKRRSEEVGRIIRKGVLGGMVDWYEAEKPTEVHPFIYDALLSLVLVHAQVSATAKPLVARTLGALVEELAAVALESFGKVERFGMGGMLQATLEIEFMHQTLSQHVSPTADQTLQSIYKTISQSYYRRPTPNSASELQAELEGLKRTLVASRRATALQFLCFRRATKSSSSTTGGGGEVKSRRGAVVAT